MKLTTSHANRGRSLEIAVIESQRNIIRIKKTEPGVKFLRGGKQVIRKGSVDFIGTVVASGRAIYFDAKQTAEPRGFELALLKAHQTYELGLFHDAKAITGVLAECTAPAIDAFFWIAFPLLSSAMLRSERVIPWAHCRLLGPSTHAINFRGIPGVVIDGGGA